MAMSESMLGARLTRDVKPLTKYSRLTKSTQVASKSCVTAEAIMPSMPARPGSSGHKSMGPMAR